MFAYTYTPYASAHFDGYILHNSIEAGLTTPSPSRSPIVRFKIAAGVQAHPIYALDRLAVTIYAYCKAASFLEMDETQMQASLTATWISTDNCSNLVTTHIEWHVSSKLRVEAKKVISEMDKKGGPWQWPQGGVRLPNQRDT
jgi:hypothetical protein